MTEFVRWFVALLTWFAAEPQAVDLEQPRAAACVLAAYASQTPEKETKADAEQNQNAAPALVEDEPTRPTETGRQQPTNSSGARLLLEETQSLEAGCSNGQCFSVPTMRPRLFRKR